MTSIKLTFLTGKLHPLFSISTHESNRLLFQISKAAKVMQCSSASSRRNSEGVSVLSLSLGNNKDQLTDTRTTSCQLTGVGTVKEVCGCWPQGLLLSSLCPSENKDISLKAKSS